MADAPDLSIVIATYDRPASLALTLASCQAQANKLGLAIEIVVVDNHPSANAEATTLRSAQDGPFAVRYVGELTRNMSVLRNRCFAEAGAPLVAFIDDDEVADADWTDALVSALRDAGAAIAVGPRLARFASGSPPAYDPRGEQFIRDIGLADGALVELTSPSGKPRYGLGTGNSIFDLAACFAPGDEPMRPQFGDAGGEDAELFVRLHRTGRRIVWAARAKVTETVAEHRTSIAYRLLRTRRETQHYVAIYLDGARRPKLVWLSLMVKGLVQTALGAVLASLSCEYRSETRVRGRLLMAHGLGKLTWRRSVGYIYQSSSETKTLA